MYPSKVSFVLRQRLRPQHDSRQPLESSTRNISRRHGVLQNGLPSPHHLPLVPHQQVQHSVPRCIGLQTCTDQRNLFSQRQPAGKSAGLVVCKESQYECPKGIRFPSTCGEEHLLSGHTSRKQKAKV